MKIKIILVLITSIWISCSKKKNDIYGCMDPTSNTYNPDATVDDGSCNYDRTFVLEGEYEYPQGSLDPPIFKNLIYPSEIQFTSISSQFYGILSGNYSTITIPNFRIFDNYSVPKQNYLIKSIKTEEYADNMSGWIEQVEFSGFIEKSTDLSVVLVLDCSSSLGNSFQNVKDYSKEFVNYIFNENPDVKIGVISFADNIYEQQITSDKSAILAFIDGMQQDTLTALYDGMNAGIDLLNNITSESKVLLTFTDGVSNNNTLGVDKYFLHDKLTNNNISSYTIGLKGNGTIDTPTLEYLALNGGRFDFPNNINELQSTFQVYKKAIANIYTFKYKRSDDNIYPAIKIRFTITAEPL